MVKQIAIFFTCIVSLFGIWGADPVLAAPVRGQAGDGWADIVIGKPDFNQITPFTTANDAFFLPHGVIIDRRNPTDNKMYIYDSGNDRILGYDVEDCLSAGTSPLNCEPTLVIGQPDFSTSGCNGDGGFQNYPDWPQPTAATICGIRPDVLSIAESESGSSMDIDADGNLWFFDPNNHRVLRYNDPFNTDSIADDVWGQDDFTSRECNKGNETPDATTLCYGWGNSNNWTTGVDVDSAGNLWVNDSYNNRILRFPNEGGTVSKTADLVLGQEDFTSNGSGDGLDQLFDPSVVRVTDEGVVYIADHGNNRVMRYTSPTTGGDGEVFGSGFAHPSGIDFDDTQPGRIWISDIGHSQAELWDEDTETLVLSVGRLDDGNLLGEASGSIGFDSNGNMFAAVGAGETDNNVLVFLKSDYLVDPDNYSYLLNYDTRYGNTMDATNLGSGRGVVVTDEQLIISDLGRILFWNTPDGVGDLSNGKTADGYVGASSFTTPRDSCCPLIARDEIGNLYAVYDVEFDTGFRIDIYELPLTTGEEPVNTLIYPFDALGGGELTYREFFGTFSGVLPAPDSSYVWLSDNTANRVMRMRDPLGPSPVIDVVLGQNNITDTDANMGGSVTDDSLWNPGLLAFDIFNNLYIADDWLEAQGNNRIIIYNADTFPTDNEEIIFATLPAHIRANIATWQPIFDPYNRMIVGYNPYFTGMVPEFPVDDRWFPGIYNNIIAGDSVPDDHLEDYFSMGYTTAWDDDYNLYISDINRARVLIYFQPLRGDIPALTEVTPVPTPSTDTTPEYTFSTTKAGTISYGGSCSSSTTDAVEGNNTVTFAELPPGIYSDCTITVIDFYGQISDTLPVSSFTITGDPGPSPTPSPTPMPTPTPSSTPSGPGSSADVGSPAPAPPQCTLTQPSGQPDLFEISPNGRTSVTLFFSPVLSATDHYFVSYSTDPSAQEYGFQFPKTQTGVTSVTVESLRPGTNYYFKVRAGNGCQPGEWSNILAATTGQRFSSYRWSSAAMIVSVGIARIFDPSAIQQQAVDAATGDPSGEDGNGARPLVMLEVQPPLPPLTPGYVIMWNQTQDLLQKIFP